MDPLSTNHSQDLPGPNAVRLVGDTQLQQSATSKFEKHPVKTETYVHLANESGDKAEELNEWWGPRENKVGQE
ncbi:hypothetical protein F1880_000209 [Penicillium rolfsii]|nr:hypothetical protein F1880_000209 [Penicillium rolfsii]